MSRRGENIRKRSDGRWESRLLSGETGKYKYFYGKNYSEVKRKRLEYKRDCDRDIMPEANTVLFSDIFNMWLSETQVIVKPSTYMNYSGIIRLHLLPMFGETSVGDLTAETVNNALSQWLKTDGAMLSPKYVRDILSVLRSCLSFAVRKYGCTADVEEILSVSAEKKDIKVLNIFEQQRLTEYLLRSPNYSKIGILVCLYTGLRIGEICALKWSDIHVAEGYIDVNKTMYRIKNIAESANCKSEPSTTVVVGKPKTESSARRIPICDFIEKILSETGTHDPEKYFLTNSDKYIEPRAYQYRFKAYLKEAGIRDINFHALRHTFATNCIGAGCDVKSLSEILGHSGVKITLDRYVHPSMDSKKNQLNKLAVYSV